MVNHPESTSKTRSEYLQGKTELSDVDIINILDLPVEKRSINNEIYTDKSYKELRNNPEELSSLTENLKTKPEYLKYHSSYIAKSKLLYQESDVLCNEIPCLIVLDQLKKTSYLLPYEYAANKSGAAITSADALKSNTFTDFKRVFNHNLHHAIEKGAEQGKDIFFLINSEKLNYEETKKQLIKFTNNRTSENKEGTYLFFSEKNFVCYSFESDKDGFVRELSKHDLKEIRAAISSKPLTPNQKTDVKSASSSSEINIPQENSDVNDFKQIRLANIDKPLHPTRSQTEMSATSSDNINLPQNKSTVNDLKQIRAAISSKPLTPSRESEKTSDSLASNLNITHENSDVNELFSSLLLRGEITLLEKNKDIENRQQRYFAAVKSLEELNASIYSETIKKSNSKFIEKEYNSRFFKSFANTQRIVYETSKKQIKPESTENNLVQAKKIIELVDPEKSMTELANVIKNKSQLLIKNPELKDVVFDYGSFGDLTTEDSKGGFGIAHIIQRRNEKDRLTKDEIAGLLILIKQYTETEKPDCYDNTKTRAFINKSGIRIVLQKNWNGNNNSWIVSGYGLRDNNDKIKTEAIEAIRAVSAQYGYKPEHSFFREQVGATIASIQNIRQQQQNVKIEKKQSVTETGKKQISTANAKTVYDRAVLKSSAKELSDKQLFASLVASCYAKSALKNKNASLLYKNTRNKNLLQQAADERIISSVESELKRRGYFISVENSADETILNYKRTISETGKKQIKTEEKNMPISTEKDFIKDFTNKKVSIQLNDKKNGVEIKFADTPLARKENALIKAAGFRWSESQQLWYARQNENSLGYAVRLRSKILNEMEQNGEKTYSAKEFNAEIEKELNNILNETENQNIEPSKAELSNDEDNLIYADKKRSTEWERSSHVQFVTQRLSNSNAYNVNILTKSEFVNQHDIVAENEREYQKSNEKELEQWYETVDWEDPMESAEAWQNGTQEQIAYIRKRQKEKMIDREIESEQDNNLTSYIERFSKETEGRGDEIQLQKAIELALEKNTVQLTEAELNRENWNRFFPNGSVETPIGTVKLGENQFNKLQKEDRNNLLAAMYETLSNPSIVLEKETVDKNSGDFKPVNVYGKSFIREDSNHKRIVESVVIFKDGNEISIGTHNKDIGRFARQIKTADQIIFADSEISRVASLILENGGSHVQLKGINTQALNSDYSKDTLLSIKKIQGQFKSQDEIIDRGIESVQSNGGMSEASMEAEITAQNNASYDSEGDSMNKNQKNTFNDTPVFKNANLFLEENKKGELPFFAGKEKLKDGKEVIEIKPHPVVDAITGRLVLGTNQILAQDVFLKTGEYPANINVITWAEAKANGIQLKKGTPGYTISTKGKDNSYNIYKLFSENAVTENSIGNLNRAKYSAAVKLKIAVLNRQLEQEENEQNKSIILSNLAYAHLDNIQGNILRPKEIQLGLEKFRQGIELESRTKEVADYIENLPKDVKEVFKERIMTVSGKFDNTTPEGLVKNYNPLQFEKRASERLEKAAEIQKNRPEQIIDARNCTNSTTFIAKFAAATSLAKANQNVKFITDKSTNEKIQKDLTATLEKSFSEYSHSKVFSIGEEANEQCRAELKNFRTQQQAVKQENEIERKKDLDQSIDISLS